MKEGLPPRAHIPGESVDLNAQRIIRLVHTVVDNATEFQKRHRKFIGTLAVVAPSAFIVASFAINRLLANDHNISDDVISSTITDKHLHEAEQDMHNKSRLQKARKIVSNTSRHLH